MTDKEAIEMAIRTLVHIKGSSDTPHIIAACSIAISALQERVKRNKGCDVCNRSDELAHLDFTYCPYCGRKLKEEP